MNSPKPRKPQPKANTVQGRLALFNMKIAEHNRKSVKGRLKLLAKRKREKELIEHG